VSVPARQLPLLDDAVRIRLETHRAQRTVSVLRLYDAAAVRLRRAEPADAVAIHALLEQYVAEGVVLPRSLQQIYRAIRDFVIAEEDGMVVGCGALRIYNPGLAEVGALAVAPRLQGQGVGRRVVETLIEDARALGIERVFALTMQVEFFGRLEFAPVAVSEFPEKIATDCAACPRRAHCPEIAVARLV
jgi:amino-acid N-acetyltransferase